MNKFINFWLLSLATRRERHKSLKPMPTITMLTPTPRCGHFVVLKISAGRDPNWSELIRSEKLNYVLQQSNLNYPSFQNPQILRTISAGHNVIHPLNSLQQPSSPISCLGVYNNKWWLSYPFCVDLRLHIWLWHLN